MYFSSLQAHTHLLCACRSRQGLLLATVGRYQHLALLPTYHAYSTYAARHLTVGKNTRQVL